jgi:hypothetical protein
LSGFLASLASRSLTDGGQVFQADETVGMVVHDALADSVIGRLLQPTSSALIEEEHF